MKAKEVLKNVWDYLEGINKGFKDAYLVEDVAKDLAIFDWFPDYISKDEFEQMQEFLTAAIDLGFDGYVCFKLGCIGTSNGMWAYKKDSKDGNSPNGAFIYRTFMAGTHFANEFGDIRDDYWDACDDDQVYLTKKIGLEFDGIKTIEDMRKYERANHE